MDCESGLQYGQCQGEGGYDESAEIGQADPGFLDTRGIKSVRGSQRDERQFCRVRHERLGEHGRLLGCHV